jgi:hypothetical protein
MKQLNDDMGLTYHLDSDEDYTCVTLIVMNDKTMEPEFYINALKLFAKDLEERNKHAIDIFDDITMSIH